MPAPAHRLRVLTPAAFWAANATFLALAAACLLWARWRTEPGPAFPGPRPVGPVFKVWLVVIWAVGLLLPLAALLLEGGQRPVRLGLGFYLALFMLQVAFEMLAWKRWRSPVWVIVPCLFLPWRLFQVGMAAVAIQGLDAPLTLFTLWALAVLWVINIGVHYTNIPNTMRWSSHPHDAAFAALRDPRVFVDGAQ
jgi:hypothetical protein